MKTFLLPAASSAFQLLPEPPEPAGDYAALLYGYYLFMILIVTLLGLILWLLKNNYSQSIRHTRITEKFNSTSDSFEDTVRIISETTNRRLAVVEQQQTKQTELAAAAERNTALIQTDLTDHDKRAKEFINASNSREQETLEIVKTLPEKMDTITAAVELLRKEALEKLEQTHQETREQLDRQFEEARQAMEATFKSVAVVVEQVESDPDKPPEPPAPEPPPSTPASAPPPGNPEQEEIPDEEPQKKIA